MMLPACWVLFKKPCDGGIPRQRLDKLYLCSIHRPVSAGGVNETDLNALVRQVERFMDFCRAHHVAVKDDAVSDGRRCNTNMVETTEFHTTSSQRNIIMLFPRVFQILVPQFPQTQRNPLAR